MIESEKSFRELQVGAKSALKEMEGIYIPKYRLQASYFERPVSKANLDVDPKAANRVDCFALINPETSEIETVTIVPDTIPEGVRRYCAARKLLEELFLIQGVLPRPIYESEREILEYIRRNDPSALAVYKALRRGEIIHLNSSSWDNMVEDARIDLEDTLTLLWSGNLEVVEEIPAW